MAYNCLPLIVPRKLFLFYSVHLRAAWLEVNSVGCKLPESQEQTWTNCQDVESKEGGEGGR